MYVGANIRMFFEEEKAALLQQIDGEFEKVKDEKPPAPTRRFKEDEEEEEQDGGEGNEGGEEDDEGAGGGINMEDMVDRVSIRFRICNIQFFFSFSFLFSVCYFILKQIHCFSSGTAYNLKFSESNSRPFSAGRLHDALSRFVKNKLH